MKKETIKLKELEPLIRKILAEGGTFLFAPRGTSMQPFIYQGHDQVLLAPLPDGRLKKYQIVLYKRENGAYVLHRIVKVEKDSYTMRGDNQFQNENGIKKEQMIGVVTKVISKEKEKSMETVGARCAAMLWIKTAFLRRIYRMTKQR